MSPLRTWVLALILSLLAAAPPAFADGAPFSASDLRAIEVSIAALEARAGELPPFERVQLTRSIAFAREAHEGQRRNGGEPAIVHSLRVAEAVLASSPRNGTAAMAAVLHDVVEDTRVGLDPIRRRFGNRVATAVDALSLPEIAEGSTKEARDKAYYERFARASRDAHLVKLRDRLDNIRDMRGFTLEGQLGYLASTRAKVVEALRPQSPDLARILEAEVTRLERSVRATMATAEAESRLQRYRRADGTLKWGEMTREGALRQAGGVAHFAFALFLKELAVVVQTGDRGRIEEFFDGLLSTDFYVNYGLFAVGAQAGNVAYARYLERLVRPGFVSQLLKTNVALATGLALPELVRGHLDGKTFAIQVASLGLSTTAVKAAVSAIPWVTRLDSSRWLAASARARRFARVGGWFYTAAETAVILYFGDELAAAAEAWLSEREARDALAEASEKLLAAARGEGDLEEALAELEQTYDDWRAWQLRGIVADQQQILDALHEVAQQAKRLEDRRQAALDQLDRFPALKQAILRRHGSLEGYAQERVEAPLRELTEELNERLAPLEARRRAALDALYEPSASPIASDDELRWLAAGAVAGSEADPYGGRGDLAARLGRWRLRRDLRSRLREPGTTRPATFASQAALLDLARELAGPEGQAQIDEARARLRELSERDAQLANVSSRGAAGALSDELQGR